MSTAGRFAAVLAAIIIMLVTVQSQPSQAGFGKRVTVTNISKSSAIVNVGKVSRLPKNVQINLEVRREDESRFRMIKLPPGVPVKYKLRSLSPATTYIVKVTRGKKKLRYGRTSFTTSGAANKSKVAVTMVKASSVRVKWNPSRDFEAYRVRWIEKEDSKSRSKYKTSSWLPSDRRVYIIRKLKPNKRYKVNVQSKGASGKVRNFGTADFRTKMVSKKAS